MKDKDTDLLSEAYTQVNEGKFLPGTDIPNEAEWGKYTKKRKTLGEYSIYIRFTDNNTGKVEHEMESNIAGGEAAWDTYAQMQQMLRRDEEE